jgi:hypothetical protein
MPAHMPTLQRALGTNPRKKARWITISALAVLLAALTPLAAQGAVPIQDPDDVTLETIDLKSAVVKRTEGFEGERALGFVLEAYENFGCAPLQRGGDHTLGFVSDFPSTPETHDVRFRAPCNHTGRYFWTVRFIQYGYGGRSRATEDSFVRPDKHTVVIKVPTDWYLGAGGEVPARWKAISIRRDNSGIAEKDTAPDRSWQDFGFEGSF